MSNDRYRYPDLQVKYERTLQRIRQMTDQEILAAYSREMVKLKLLTRFGRHSEHFKGHPNTLVMNRSRRIIAARNLSLPHIVLPEPVLSATSEKPMD